jgi:hypothetical protein
MYHTPFFTLPFPILSPFSRKWGKDAAVVSLLPPLFVPIRRSCLVINLSSLVMYDYRGLGSAWDRIRPYWKQRNGPQSVTILDLEIEILPWRVSNQQKEHTSQVCDDYSITATGAAGQGGIRIIDFVRHNDGLI